jgi:SAM-dependent methyltransferase
MFGLRKRLLSMLDPGQTVNATSDQLDYALNEISELRQQIRMLLAASPEFKAQIAQTYESFDTQWDLLPSGEQLLGSDAFDRESVSLLEKYTGMPPAWFIQKTVLDAGAGNGRWSYTFSKLGAQVTAVDQSAAGIADVSRVCAEFPRFKAFQLDLLESLPFDGRFDAVWSFGVVHHTGDTRRALHNICQALKPGGYLFAMVYGEPRPGRSSEFAEINSYVALRRETAGMTARERIEYLRARFPEDQINAWFDGLSPKINDLHRFDEIREWLRVWGFADIVRTFDNRNIILRATRKP